MNQCFLPLGSNSVTDDVIQLIQTVTAVDPDEPLGGQHFYYSLAPEAANNPNFTLRDNQGTVNMYCPALLQGLKLCSSQLYSRKHLVNKNVAPGDVNPELPAFISAFFAAFYYPVQHSTKQTTKFAVGSNNQQSHALNCSL